MRRTRAFTAVVTIAVLAATGSASAAGWEKISRDGLGNTAEATTVLSGTSIVAAWTWSPAPGVDSLEAVTFSTSLTDSVQSPVTVPIVNSWPNLSSDPELLTAPDGSIAIAFDGTHSLTTGDPQDGINFASRAATGAWNLPVAVIPNQSAGYGIGALFLPDGSSLVTGDCCGGAAFIFHGAVKVGDAALGGTVTNRTLARDGAGNIWAAWYDLKQGMVMRQLDPVTGIPAAALPSAAPGSTSIDNNGSRVSLVCNPTAAGCRIVYQTADNRSVVSWAPGEPAPTTIGTVGKDDRIGALNAAYKADGRLWAAWVDHKGIGDSVVQFALGNAKGAGSPAYPVALQKLDTPYHLRLQPVGDNLLMIGNFTTPGNTAGSSQWANLVGIPGAIVDNTGPKDVTLEGGTAKGTFRIQVQFKAPTQCGASCKAHADLRNRTGICSATCLARGSSKLPGDGPVVMGTRGTFTLPGTKKIRFYMNVTKTALSKTPFHTEGGYRVGNTRLRVYLTTKSGTVLAVRDGRIKVSIARIQSGALPGLTGIL